MRRSIVGFGFLAFSVPVLLALHSCSSAPGDLAGGAGAGAGSGGGAQGSTGGSGAHGGAVTSGGGSNLGLDGGTGGSAVPFEDAGFTAPDCPGCTFPPRNAPPCGANAPAIRVVYPTDGVLVPPNMNVISVQWTPFGPPYQEFEVDLENAVTDMRVVTKCAAQTVDTEQPPQPSGGCQLVLDPAMWKFVADHNRGGDPVTITVRGTTDGKCASSSAGAVKLSFAQDDMLGAIYYWKSTVSANGVGGQIWVKSFGDSNPETLVTLTGTCNGCHALSRDGARMVINSDDNDSDDEYSDVRSTLIDMAMLMRIGGKSDPGFATFSPDHGEYLRSNGLGNTNPPTNTFALFDGIADGKQPPVNNVGGANAEPTMPDWSPDGKSVVFVIPKVGASWTNSHGTALNDDDHIFGGSLFTMPYAGNQQFGAPSPLLMSGGENNYYPSYSPDGQLVVFNRAAADGSVPSIDGCTGAPPHATCPNDSFSNPNARVMLMPAKAGAKPVDLEAANGSPAAQPVPVSNSWAKWSPFLQSNRGHKLLWIAFSSTRDYGLLVRNHQPGMYQCYPADSYEDPGAAHHQPFDPTCRQPQLWMAAVDVTAAAAGGGQDPSHVAFWLPFQDMTTHNHTPQWTQTVANMDGGVPDSGMCIPTGGNCLQDPSACCMATACQANGTCGPIIK